MVCGMGYSRYHITIYSYGMLCILWAWPMWELFDSSSKALIYIFCMAFEIWYFNASNVQLNYVVMHMQVIRQLIKLRIVNLSGPNATHGWVFMQSRVCCNKAVTCVNSQSLSFTFTWSLKFEILIGTNEKQLGFGVSILLGNCCDLLSVCIGNLEMPSSARVTWLDQSRLACF